MPAKHGRTLEIMAQRKKSFTEEHEGHDSARMKCPQQTNEEGQKGGQRLPGSGDGGGERGGGGELQILGVAFFG